MSAKTSIEWTRSEDGSPGFTWNPVSGCDKVSPGCDHCYAETIAERFRGGKAYPNGFALTLKPERLTDPLRKRSWRGKRVFVNSMSDLFHKDVPDEFIAQVFAVMALTPEVTFQLLTKRHGRMRSLLSSAAFEDAVGWTCAGLSSYWVRDDLVWPLPNVWLGVSVEDQQRADLRIPALLATPAAVRWLSCEPLIGPLSFRWAHWVPLASKPGEWTGHLDGLKGIDWVVVGGESGPGARPMHLEWARSLRDECAEVGVPFFFKQWGDWAPTYRVGMGDLDNPRECYGGPAQSPWHEAEREILRHVGKKSAGRELDGRTWDEYPEVTQ